MKTVKKRISWWCRPSIRMTDADKTSNSVRYEVPARVLVMPITVCCFTLYGKRQRIYRTQWTLSRLRWWIRRQSNAIQEQVLQPLQPIIRRCAWANSEHAVFVPRFSLAEDKQLEVTLYENGIAADFSCNGRRPGYKELRTPMAWNLASLSRLLSI